jgi:hypothetical protein
MLVSPQVVNPELGCPRFFGGGFTIEEEEIGLDALGVEDAGREMQQGVNVGLFQELATDSLASAAFEENVIGNNNGGATVLFQDGEDMLEKVWLFVARARPEIIALNDERFNCLDLGAHVNRPVSKSESQDAG